MINLMTYYDILLAYIIEIMQKFHNNEIFYRLIL